MRAHLLGSGLWMKGVAIGQAVLLSAACHSSTTLSRDDLARFAATPPADCPEGSGVWVEAGGEAVWIDADTELAIHLTDERQLSAVGQPVALSDGVLTVWEREGPAQELALEDIAAAEAINDEPGLTALAITGSLLVVLGMVGFLVAMSNFELDMDFDFSSGSEPCCW